MQSHTSIVPNRTEDHQSDSEAIINGNVKTVETTYTPTEQQGLNHDSLDVDPSIPKSTEEIKFSKDADSSSLSSDGDPASQQGYHTGNDVTAEENGSKEQRPSKDHDHLLPSGGVVGEGLTNVTHGHGSPPTEVPQNNIAVKTPTKVDLTAESTDGPTPGTATEAGKESIESSSIKSEARNEQPTTKSTEEIKQALLIIKGYDIPTEFKKQIDKWVENPVTIPHEELPEGFGKTIAVKYFQENIKPKSKPAHFCRMFGLHQGNFSQWCDPKKKRSSKDNRLAVWRHLLGYESLPLCKSKIVFVTTSAEKHLNSYQDKKEMFSKMKTEKKDEKHTVVSGIFVTCVGLEEDLSAKEKEFVIEARKEKLEYIKKKEKTQPADHYYNAYKFRVEGEVEVTHCGNFQGTVNNAPLLLKHGEKDPEPKQNDNLPKGLILIFYYTAGITKGNKYILKV